MPHKGEGTFTLQITITYQCCGTHRHQQRLLRSRRAQHGAWCTRQNSCWLREVIPSDTGLFEWELLVNALDYELEPLFVRYSVGFRFRFGLGIKASTEMIIWFLNWNSWITNELCSNKNLPLNWNTKLKKACNFYNGEYGFIGQYLVADLLATSHKLVPQLPTNNY